MYRMESKVEKLDREDLCVWNERETREHGKRMKMTTCWMDVKYSFPSRSIEAWNRLEEEVVCARNIHDFKNVRQK